MIREEQRKYFRFGCSCFGEVRFKNKSVEKVSVKNISSEGLKIIAGNRELSVGDQIEIRLDIPGERIPPLVSGRIKWMNPKDESVELGVELNEVDRDVKRELIDYGFSVWRDRLHQKH